MVFKRNLTLIHRLRKDKELAHLEIFIFVIYIDAFIDFLILPFENVFHVSAFFPELQKNLKTKTIFKMYYGIRCLFQQRLLAIG